MFQGFTEETIQFLWGVRFNNERPWFLAHKQEYLDHVYEPLRELGAQVQERMDERYPKRLFNLKVSRIYRDARRLHGRGPYKTHMWFVLREPIEENTDAPSFYFEISPEGYEYGMGYYCQKPSLMERYRRKVAREPARMEKLARRLNRQKRFVLEGERYKRPKMEASDLLRPWVDRKFITLCSFHPYDERCNQPELVEDILDGFAFLMPFYQFFWELALEPAE